MQQILATLQGLQTSQTAMQQMVMAAEHEVEKDRLNNQLTLAAGRVTTLEATVISASTSLIQLSAASDALTDERRLSMDVIRSLPAALDKLAESNKKSGGKRALMDNKGLGKPYSLSDNNPDGKFRMWAIRTEEFVSAIYGEDLREIMRWTAEQEHPLDDTEVDSHGNLCGKSLGHGIWRSG